MNDIWSNPINVVCLIALRLIEAIEHDHVVVVQEQHRACLLSHYPTTKA